MRVDPTPDGIPVDFQLKREDLPPRVEEVKKEEKEPRGATIPGTPFRDGDAGGLSQWQELMLRRRTARTDADIDGGGIGIGGEQDRMGPARDIASPAVPNSRFIASRQRSTMVAHPDPLPRLPNRVSYIYKLLLVHVYMYFKVICDMYFNSNVSAATQGMTRALMLLADSKRART